MTRPQSYVIIMVSKTQPKKSENMNANQECESKFKLSFMQWIADRESHARVNNTKESQNFEMCVYLFFYSIGEESERTT